MTQSGGPPVWHLQRQYVYFCTIKAGKLGTGAAAAFDIWERDRRACVTPPQASAFVLLY